MLGTLIENNSSVDINDIHKMGIPGQRFEFARPVKLYNGGMAYEFYYNGYQDVTELEFEDGSKYKFTNNHRLLVKRNGKKVWVTVEHLNEDDEIVSI
jgi:intein/homing endonuclease